MKIVFCPNCGFRFVRPHLTNGHDGTTEYEHYIVDGAHAVYVCRDCSTLMWLFKNGEVWASREPRCATDADMKKIKENVELWINYIDVMGGLQGDIEVHAVDTEITMSWSC